MIVRTRSGTTYEFRLREVDVTDMSDKKQRLLPSGWEGVRHSSERTLHVPIKEWLPVKITLPPEVGLCMRVQFEGHEVMNTTAILWLEISDKEREALNA
jgi:hypothetical protein